MSRYTSALKDPSVVSNVAIGLDIAAFAGVENAFLDDARLVTACLRELVVPVETKARNERTKAAEGESIFVTARDERRKISLSLSRARTQKGHIFNQREYNIIIV